MDACRGKNVLVLGGTNNMGIYLVRKLIEDGNYVTIATRGVHKDGFGPEVDRIIINRKLPETMRDAFRGKHYDVIFDNTAYCSNYVKHLLNNVRCDRYVQLSSVTTYPSFGSNMVESGFDPFSHVFEWSDADPAKYASDKRAAESATFTAYPEISAVVVRVPYVVKTDRLLFFFEHIDRGLPMRMDDIEKEVSFVCAKDVGNFLSWISVQNFEGPINFSAGGAIKIKDLISYVESKVSKKANLDKSGKMHPFGFPSHYMSTKLASDLGYGIDHVEKWFWKAMDYYENMYRRQTHE
jgi:hypothetical protein